MQTSTNQSPSLNLLLLILLLSCSVKEKPVSTSAGVKSSQKVKESTAEPKVVDFQMNLWQQGIDFYARGNEPSWALDMDFEKQLQFSTMDGFKISVPVVKGDKAMDANVTRYYAEVESGTLIITIQEQKCNDTMSDQQFDFSVTIQVKLGNENDYKEYSGCGNYVADYSLHDIWVLKSLNEKTLKQNELPRFEFFAKDRRILGNASCNDFSGSYYHIGIKELQFSDMSMTKKLCDDMEIENILYKSVFGRRMKYSKESLNLILSGYDGIKLVFKKID